MNGRGRFVIKKERRNAQRVGGKQIHVLPQAKGRKTFKGKRKISPNGFSKKSVIGNLQGSNFTKEGSVEARLQGVSE